VARLIAKSPLDGVLPVAAEGAVLSEVDFGPITSVAPFRGKAGAVTAALKRLGLSFPAPGRTHAKGAARILWAGRDQALLLGVAAPAVLKGIAALTDQGDGLACLRLEGPLAEAALARLVPLDLRAGVFKRGHTARTMLFHMTCSLTRVGPEAFEIMVMRSMGRTAVHDLIVAMKSVAAQA
jgi:sarcosine oxidase subunit gamma